MAGSGTPLAYRRLLLKLSGEALMGKGASGIDVAVVDRLARDIARSRGRRMPRSPSSSAAAISSAGWPAPPRAWIGPRPTTWACWRP